MGSGAIWLTTRETSEQLGISIRQLYRLIDSGALPAFKHGRIIRLRQEDVDGFGDGGSAGVLAPVDGPPASGAPGAMLPAPVGVRPSVNRARDRPPGLTELDTLERAGMSLEVVAQTVGARPDRAWRWRRDGVPNRWLRAVRQLAEAV